MHEILIEIGIMFLLIYTPFTFGGVTQTSAAVMECVTGVLMFIWLAKIFAHRRHLPHRTHASPSAQYSMQIFTSSLFVPLAIFLGIVLFQCCPLPANVVKFLSPNTYRVYADAALTTQSPIPAFFPLSVCAYATQNEWFQALTYLAIFFLIVNNLQSPPQMKRMIYLILTIGLFESLYGLLEYFSGRQHIFLYKKTFSATVSGTFVNRNHFAGYMEMVIPLTFSVLFARLNDRMQTVSKTFVRLFDEKYMKAFLIGFLLLVMISAQLLSGSRGGSIGFACGMGCLILLAYNRRLLRKSAVVVLIIVIVAIGIAAIVGHDLLIERLQTLTRLSHEESFQYRRDVWKTALVIARDFPIFGSGFGTFSHIFPRYQPFASSFAFPYVENEYLQLLAETGVVGILLIFVSAGIFFSTTLTAWKQRHSRWSIVLVAGGISAMASLLIHSSVDFHFHIPANALLFTVIAALTYTAAHSRRQTSQ